MTREELLVRHREIQEKYTLFRRVYREWMEVVNEQTRALGLKNFKERNKLPVYQKGEGIKVGLSILEWNLERGCSADEVIQILTDQANEPSCPDHFKAGVQMVLNDVLAEKVEPFQPAMLGIEGGSDVSA
jgi:hypothetical protein